MRLRLNSRNGHKPARAKVAPRPSPMNWRPRGPDDLIGQAREVCSALVAKARRLRDTRTAACKLLLYGPPGVCKTTVAELVASELTGTPMFGGDSVIAICMHQVETRAVRPSEGLDQSIDDDLESLILRALAKDPAQRPQTAQEFLDAVSARCTAYASEALEALQE